MELIDNINKTLKGDFVTELHSGSKVAIAASCFSIYAFEELKAQLKEKESRTTQHNSCRAIVHKRFYGLVRLW